MTKSIALWEVHVVKAYYNNDVMQILRNNEEWFRITGHQSNDR